jgi:hypothetical protein
VGTRLKVWKMKPIEARPQPGDLALAKPGHVLTVELDAPCRGPVQPAEQVEQRGLAVPRAALNCQPLTVLDVQSEIADRGNVWRPLT